MFASEADSLMDPRDIFDKDLGNTKTANTSNGSAKGEKKKNIYLQRVSNDDYFAEAGTNRQGS